MGLWRAVPGKGPWVPVPGRHGGLGAEAMGGKTQGLQILEPMLGPSQHGSKNFNVREESGAGAGQGLTGGCQLSGEKPPVPEEGAWN